MSSNTHSRLPAEEVHIPYRKIFEDEAELLSDSTEYNLEDLYKKAYVKDSNTEYVLTSFSPVVWSQVSGGGGAGSLQGAYDGGATIITASGSDINFNLSDGDFIVNGPGKVQVGGTTDVDTVKLTGEVAHYGDYLRTASNYSYLNDTYVGTVEVDGGIVYNTSSSTDPAITSLVAAGGYVAGVAGVSQPSITISNTFTSLNFPGKTFTLPQATIPVLSTAGFSSSGTILVAYDPAGFATVNYTGITPTEFTGCTGGSGDAKVAGAVFDDTISGDYFKQGDIIQISGADDEKNNGLFEVLSFSGNTLTLNGVGTTPTTLALLKTQLINNAGASGSVTVVKINGLIYSTASSTWKEYSGFNTNTIQVSSLGIADLQEAYDGGDGSIKTSSSKNISFILENSDFSISNLIGLNDVNVTGVQNVNINGTDDFDTNGFENISMVSSLNATFGTDADSVTASLLDITSYNYTGGSYLTISSDSGSGIGVIAIRSKSLTNIGAGTDGITNLQFGGPGSGFYDQVSSFATGGFSFRNPNTYNSATFDLGEVSSPLNSISFYSHSDSTFSVIDDSINNKKLTLECTNNGTGDGTVEIKSDYEVTIDTQIITFNATGNSTIQVDSNDLTIGTINVGGSLNLSSGGYIYLTDQYTSAGGFSIPLKLSDSSTEWSNFETNFSGEVSLLNAINQLATSISGLNLDQVLSVGNQTGGSDIILTSGDKIIGESTSVIAGDSTIRGGTATGLALTNGGDIILRPGEGVNAGVDGSVIVRSADGTDSIKIQATATQEITIGTTFPLIYNATTGKLTIPGVIDPTAIVFEKSTAPSTGATEGAIFISDGTGGLRDGEFYVRRSSDAAPSKLSLLPDISLLGDPGADGDTLSAFEDSIMTEFIFDQPSGLSETRDISPPTFAGQMLTVTSSESWTFGSGKEIVLYFADIGVWGSPFKDTDFIVTLTNPLQSATFIASRRFNNDTEFRWKLLDADTGITSGAI
jgi:hypothetical protein